MHRDIISTESGRTVLTSNQRYYGPRTIPLLFLHGGPGLANLEAVDLIDYDGPIYTYAQFGCGGSDEKEDYTVELFVQQLREVIEYEFKDQDIILMGLSWGGALALLYVEKYGTGHISGLILSSPIINSEDDRRTNKERISHLPKEVREAIDKGNHENNANLLYLTKKGNVLAAKFSEMFNFRKISE